jgi:hypothetical protein
MLYLYSNVQLSIFINHCLTLDIQRFNQHKLYSLAHHANMQLPGAMQRRQEYISERLWATQAVLQYGFYFFSRVWCIYCSCISVPPGEYKIYLRFAHMPHSNHLSRISPTLIRTTMTMTLVLLVCLTMSAMKKWAM